MPSSQWLIYTCCRATNSGTWADAQRKHPNFALESKLQAFSRLKDCQSKSTIPLPLREYCQAVIKHAEAQTGQSSNTITQDGSHCLFVKSQYDTITKGAIKQQLPTFEGAGLVVFDGSSTVSYCMTLSLNRSA